MKILHGKQKFCSFTHFLSNLVINMIMAFLQIIEFLSMHEKKNEEENAKR